MSFPVRFQEVIKLTSLEIAPNAFKFGICNFESDKYISVKETAQDGSGILTIVELDQNFKYTRKPNKAESVIMHPEENIIALKAKTESGNGSIVQIFNMDLKQKLKNSEFDDPVVFWKWVSTSKLAVVTTKSVFTLDIRKQDEGAIKILDRAGQLENQSTQIIGFGMDSQEKWCSLFGISSPDQGKTILGHIQLFLIEGGKQQLLEGHCCCFSSSYVHDDVNKSELFCFVERKQGETSARVNIIEISAPPAGYQKFKKQTEIIYDPSQANDFPVYMQVSQKYGLLFLVTKFGYLFVYELTSAQMIFRTKISQDTIFVGARNSKNDGLYCINKQGNLISIAVDETSLIQYMLQNCQFIPNVQQLAFTLASRYKLPGVDGMFVEQFNKALIANDYKQAATLAAQAPGTLLRNPETVNRFKQLQQLPGQPQPILIYFQTLLEKGKLNQFESLELCRPVVQQNRLNLVENWLNANQLEASEELGDLLKPFNIQLAIRVYESCKAQQKLMQCYVETGQTDKVMQFTKSSGVKLDYQSMIRDMVMVDPQGAMNTAIKVCQNDSSQNVHAIAEIFLNAQKLPEMTQFLCECMKENRPEDGTWQTKVLELNLMAAPQVAEAILNMEIWNQFNRQKIAVLCEQKNLLQRALENYGDLKDISRVCLRAQFMNPEWLVNYLGKLQSDWILKITQEMVRHNRQNVQIVVQVFSLNHQKLNIQNCIKVFESAGAFEGIYGFLRQILPTTQDKEIHYKFIEAAVKTNNFLDVEAVIKDKKDCYDPVQVKDFLKELKMATPKPLMILCDIHGFTEELTKYLMKNNLQKYIEMYLFKINPGAAPVVLGTMIDQEADETYIKQILNNLRTNLPMEELVQEFEKRSKLRMIEFWLEQRAQEGITIPALHNALAKIKIDTNQDPESFLINNTFYNSKVVGKYCEERDPHLAFTVYKRAFGECDLELIEVSNKNSLYRLQARYLVERQSQDLWALVLSPDNPHRKAIIEQVVQQALPESKNVDEVIATVNAFMRASLQKELISLLEKIVFHHSEFSSIKKLQNLLIITAIKEKDNNRVMDYIKRLNDYDGPDIAKIALGEDYQLYEEAFEIYKKFKLNVDAIDVLLNNIESITRAAEFAEQCQQQDVWSRLGHSYLDRIQVVEAIECYLKAQDTSSYQLVISQAENEGKFDELIKYLLMVRQSIKDQIIDNALFYAYAATSRLTDLEELVNNPNSADAQKVGDRCFDAKLYEAAKVLFVSIKNNAKIASCLVRLGQFHLALESAKKANSPKSWREVCIACVEAEEYKLAAIAGMNIIIHPDHLDDLIRTYEENDCADEMIELLQQGMTLDRAHIGIYTELGILYAKYHPEKLLEHIKLYFSKLNVSKLLRYCERYQRWAETVYLYSNYNEYDNAINIMIEHSPTAWSHDQFVNLLQKISNQELYYKAMRFYLDEQPMMINDLLKGISNKLDLTKTVTEIRKRGYQALIAPYLKSVQALNNQAVNEALNEIYLEQEDYVALRKSITDYENFEPLGLAKATENHELIEFRRIAAYLYRKIGKYDKSIALSKQDKVYRDCIETAKESGKSELVEELLRFFVQNGEKEYFTVCNYTCYELIKPDIVLELSWRFGLMDFAMPFMIQVVKELTNKVENVQKKQVDHEKKQEKQASQQQNQPLDVMYDMGMLHGGMNGMLNGMPMLMNQQYTPQQFQQQSPYDPYNQQQQQFGFGQGPSGYQGF